MERKDEKYCERSDKVVDDQIIFGDCFECLDSVDDCSVDLIFTDPPYGSTAQEWDKEVNFEFLWKKFKRILKKDSVIAIFSAQPFTTKLINSNIDDFKYCWYWVKNQATNFFHAKRMPMRKIEEICIFGGKRYYPQITDGHIPTNSAKGCSNGQVYYGKNKRDYVGGKTTRMPNNILDFKCVDNYSRKHPNQKPLDLCEYIVKTYTQENDVVLDCFAGSGSIGIAAKNCGRRFIMIENNSFYQETIKSRL